MSKIIEKIKKDKSKSIVIGSSIIIFMIGIVVTAFNTNNTYASSGLIDCEYDTERACEAEHGTGNCSKNDTTTCWLETTSCEFRTERACEAEHGVGKCTQDIVTNCWLIKNTCEFETESACEAHYGNGQCVKNTATTCWEKTTSSSGSTETTISPNLSTITTKYLKDVDKVYCYPIADTTSTASNSFNGCVEINVSETTSSAWAYSTTYKCYLLSTTLSSTKPSSCSNEDDSTDSGDSGNTGTGGSGNTGSGDSGNTGTGGGGTTTPTTHKVNIKYKVEGGTIASSTTLNGTTYSWTTASDGTIIRDGNELVTTVNYADEMDEDGLANYNHPNYVNINRTGYTTDEGMEWKCLSGCTEPGKTFDQGHSYSASDFCDASEGDCTVTVGVNWRPTKVKIRYNVNEGTIEPTTATTNEDGSVTTNSWTTNSDGTIIKNGDILETKVNYNQKMNNDGLANYNSYLYIDIKKQGYTTDEVKEWKCLEGCTEPGKIFNQSFSYNASDFCDASNGDCTVTVGVNWVGIKYFIEYDLNGGIVTTDSPPEGTWNTNVTIDNPTKKVTIHGNQNRTSATISKDVSRDQDFEGWTSPTINKSTAYHGDTEWKDGNVKVKDTIFKNLTSNQGGRVKMIANWKPVAVNLPTVSKNGYTCNWNTKADGKGTKYDSGARYTIESESPATINLYAECISNSKEDDDISTPPKTGDVLIVIAWAVGIGALGYAVYYFRGRKSNI